MDTGYPFSSPVPTNPPEISCLLVLADLLRKVLEIWADYRGFQYEKYSELGQIEYRLCARRYIALWFSVQSKIWQERALEILTSVDQIQNIIQSLGIEATVSLDDFFLAFKDFVAMRRDDEHSYHWVLHDLFDPSRELLKSIPLDSSYPDEPLAGTRMADTLIERSPQDTPEGAIPISFWVLRDESFYKLTRSAVPSGPPMNDVVSAIYERLNDSPNRPTHPPFEELSKLEISFLRIHEYDTCAETGHDVLAILIYSMVNSVTDWRTVNRAAYNHITTTLLSDPMCAFMARGLGFPDTDINADERTRAAAFRVAVCISHEVNIRAIFKLVVWGVRQYIPLIYLFPGIEGSYKGWQKQKIPSMPAQLSTNQSPKVAEGFGIDSKALVASSPSLSLFQRFRTRSASPRWMQVKAKFSRLLRPRALSLGNNQSTAPQMLEQAVFTPFNDSDNEHGPLLDAAWVPPTSDHQEIALSSLNHPPPSGQGLGLTNVRIALPSESSPPSPSTPNPASPQIPSQASPSRFKDAVAFLDHVFETIFKGKRKREPTSQSDQVSTPASGDRPPDKQLKITEPPESANEPTDATSRSIIAKINRPRALDLWN